MAVAAPMRVAEHADPGRALLTLDPVDDRVQVVLLAHAVRRLGAGGSAAVAEVERDEVEGLMQAGGVGQDVGLVRRKAVDEDDRRSFGPIPFAAGTYQPASRVSPSALTSASPAGVPCVAQSVMSGLASFSACVIGDVVVDGLVGPAEEDVRRAAVVVAASSTLTAWREPS